VAGMAWTPGRLRRRNDGDTAHPQQAWAISAPALFRSGAGPGGVPPVRGLPAPIEVVIDEVEELSRFVDLSQ
jgi:hypothetical protein